MANYVLVHGSAHGSWCWSRVIPILRGLGHNAAALDLPGNGQDSTPLGDVTLDTYAQYVCGALDAFDAPPVLVGHSLGGLSISRAAELRPRRVAVLVYLTALLLEPGAAFMAARSSDSGEVRRVLATRDSWDVSDDLTYVTYKPEMVPHRFYNDCTAEDAAWAQSMLVRQPVGPLLAPMGVTDANFGRVPRVYIECAQDNAVTPERAREMYAALPCAEVITMATGHSPFLSAPEELARHLHGLARYAAA